MDQTHKEVIANTQVLSNGSKCEARKLKKKKKPRIITEEHLKKIKENAALGREKANAARALRREEKGDGIDQVNPLGRLKHESAGWYNRFMRYFDMGNNRNWKDLIAEEKGLDPNDVSEFATAVKYMRKMMIAHRWEERIAIYTDSLQSKKIEAHKKMMTQEIDHKIEQQKKIHEAIMNGTLSATAEATKRLIHDLKNDPNFRLSVNELVKLGTFAIHNNQHIAPKPTTPVFNQQNNYFNQHVAKQIHSDILDLQE